MTRNICFFSGDISRVGGTERVTTVIASALAERGQHVSILSMSHGEVSGFPLHPTVKLASLHMEGRSANFSDVAKWRSLRRYVRELDVDVLVDVDTLLSWYSLAATVGLRTRVISWEHFHFSINVGDAGQRTRRWFGRWLAVRLAHAVVTLTERDRRQYLQQMSCRRPVVAIYNPVTLVTAEHSALTSHLVLAAGRLVYQKGFDLLLDAWARVARTCPDWNLRIVGSGPDANALHAQANILGVADSVEFRSHSTDMPANYQSASLYAMSSRFEGLPLVLIEAKAFGLPIVSFDCPCGPSDIVRDGVDGILVPDGEVTALADALKALIHDEDRRKRYAEAALRDRRFGIDAVVDRWQELLLN